MAKDKKTADKATPAPVFVKHGAAKTVAVPLVKLTFDRRLQHRGKLTDEDTVKEYTEFLKSGGKFKTNIQAVREVTGEGKAKVETIWVYDGFNRGAAYEEVLTGGGTVPVDIIDGTFADAYLLSLRSNSDHGLNRTGDDKRRAVFALLDNDDAREAVLKFAPTHGGVIQVIADACGVSKGWAFDSLDRRGLKAAGNKIIKKPATVTPPPPPAEPVADSSLAPIAGAAPATVPAAPVDPALQRAKDDAAYEALMNTAYEDRLKEAAKKVKGLAALVTTLMEDRTNGAKFREVMARHGVSVSEEFDVEARERGSEFQPYFAIIEHWPFAVKMLNLFADAKRPVNLADPATPAAEPAPAGEAPVQTEPTNPPEPSANGNGKVKKTRGKARNS